MSGHEYGLGQEVEFRNPLTRETFPPDFRHWVALESPEWVRGIVIGKRTLSNGHAEKQSEDGIFGSIHTWTEYRQTDHFTAWLVVPDLRRKPVLVLPEDVRAR